MKELSFWGIDDNQLEMSERSQIIFSKANLLATAILVEYYSFQIERNNEW